MRGPRRAVSGALAFVSRGVMRSLVGVLVLGAITVGALIAGTSIAGPLTLVFLGVALLTTALAVEILRRLELVERLVRVDMPKARLAALTRGFETERLDVRLPRRVPPALDRMLDEEFMHQNGWSPAQRRQLMELLRRPRWVLVEHGYLVAYERTTGEPVGLVTFSQFDRRASRCELGFMVGPAHRGRGFGTELLAASVAELHSLGIDVAVIVTRATNDRVRRCIERVGAVEVESRSTTLPDGTVAESVWYEHRGSRPS